MHSRETPEVNTRARASNPVLILALRCPCGGTDTRIRYRDESAGIGGSKSPRAPTDRSRYRSFSLGPLLRSLDLGASIGQLLAPIEDALGDVPGHQPVRSSRTAPTLRRSGTQPRSSCALLPPSRSCFRALAIRPRGEVPRSEPRRVAWRGISARSRGGTRRTGRGIRPTADPCD